MLQATPKPIIWMSDSLGVARGFPSAVQDEIGHALYLAQVGGKHEASKPLKGLGSGVLEVLSGHRGDTFRAVYTVCFAENAYVLHAFQKKVEKGCRDASERNRAGERTIEAC